MPPSTIKFVPVIYEALGEIKKTTDLDISDGFPNLLNGTLFE